MRGKEFFRFAFGGDDRIEPHHISMPPIESAERGDEMVLVKDESYGDEEIDNEYD